MCRCDREGMYQNLANTVYNHFETFEYSRCDGAITVTLRIKLRGATGIFTLKTALRRTVICGEVDRAITAIKHTRIAYTVLKYFRGAVNPTKAGCVS